MSENEGRNYHQKHLALVISHLMIKGYILESSMYDHGGDPKASTQQLHEVSVDPSRLCIKKIDREIVGCLCLHYSEIFAPYFALNQYVAGKKTLPDSVLDGIDEWIESYDKECIDWKARISEE